MSVKEGIRRRLGAARAQSLRMVGRRAYNPGLLSVVVPAYNVEAYLRECLDSLLNQFYGHIEIVVVDDGSPDGSRDIAQEYAARDKRVRVVSRPNGGLSAARNTGVENAIGEFLTFVDADDRVDPGAYAVTVETLLESGSDFAVTFYRRLRRGVTDAPGRWIRKAHGERVIGANLDTFPQAMVNAVAWGKVYRRVFYDEAGLHFPEGVLYEDQPVSMRAFARARSFDVLPHVGVEWRIRDDQTSITQQASSVRNIKAHTVAMENSIAELRAAGRERAAQIRALQLLDHNMQFFKLNAVHRDPEYWQELRRATMFLVDQVPADEYVSTVGAYKKVLNELIITDQMERAARFQEEQPSDVRRHPTRREGDIVYVDLGVDLATITPDHLRLSSLEISARCQLASARWVGSHTMRVEGWAHLDNLDLSAGAPEIAVVAESSAGERIAFEVTQRPDPRADIASDLAHADVTNAGFVADLDTRLLPDVRQRWRLRATVTDGGLTDTAAVTVRPWVEAAIRRPLVDRPGRALVVHRNRAGRTFLIVHRSPAYVVSASLVGQSLELELGGVRPVRVQLAEGVRDRAALRAELSDGPDGQLLARFDLSGLRPMSPGSSEERLALVGVGTDGHATALLDVADAEAGAEPSLAELALDRTFEGALELVRRQAAVRADAVQVSGVEGSEELVVRVSVVAGSDSGLTPVLSSPGLEVEGTLETDVDGTRRMRFPLTRSVWGNHDLMLPSEQYRIGARIRGHLVFAEPARSLVPDLPRDELHPRARVITEIHEPVRPGVRIELAPPLRDDERSVRQQYRLRARHTTPTADRRSVFFRTLYGEAANGNALGVHEELLRRGSDLTLNWSVNDHSMPIPDGGVRLIEKSREWHQAIAQSRYHMVDVHQLDWFVRPQGQDLIQTMHGYPYKVMGHEWWDKGGFPIRQVANFDRRARDWTFFVSPAAYATPLLREAFLDPAHATPKILEIGYPRNDVLLRPEGSDVRARTRALLGLSDDQVVVMYGPTFRDYLSADDTTAARVTFFDPHAAAAALPANYVILMRGHAFNARVATEREASTDRVIDVTDYPDINDLILASDAAVLDYSSLRFDYVLTGNPMVFLVPDLAEYDRTRGGVIPYPPTAPGPLVDTTAQVVSELADLAGLVARYAEARELFRKEYVELEDGHAGERLVDAVFVRRGDAARS